MNNHGYGESDSILSVHHSFWECSADVHWKIWDSALDFDFMCAELQQAVFPSPPSDHKEFIISLQVVIETIFFFKSWA